MLWTIILLCGAWALYRHCAKSHPRHHPSTPPLTRRQASGDAGEARVYAELRRILAQLCGNDFYVHPTALLLLHAPGTEFPTAEVDHLVVTPFGIFVIETKNWVGTILPGRSADHVVCHLPGGRLEERRSPISQNRTKVAFLRGTLPATWNVRGLGVFSNDACTLSAELPLAMVSLRDLGYWLRTRRDRHMKSRRPNIKVSAAWEVVRRLSVEDPTGLALSLHRHKVAGISSVNI
ncbi:nuclease-related domain-containing protein [Burkholderia pseudomallei]|uniref:nuclease-related domain-containing protein n=1 Tax=Burkholderia pseudomallei TaxID=28450 RepID=UPI0009756E29|nr:nuclease-related domain-containing protein [Burkholderia pseudomallei]MBM5588517.1 NERD domain-containing protein [Burkholderia pseudomallei]MBM5620892.1 NERD domain-containing protein [Burkholderia pseudomallei]MBM5628460.1 NERD domain-containing protein [Burkholderia pseudomallei]MBM5661510.1 NERD domain-containing protein [Burkholderia pseudomallei]OMZ42735.1 nuclease [Burkholderia pseudomallei]